MTVEKLEFSWHDYILFGLMLLISTAVGIYFGFIKKQNTSNDYLLGGREMSVFPISTSMIASMVSGLTVLAVPADIYTYGIGYWFSIPFLISGTILTYFAYLPVFYELRITSVYEYLEERFDSKVRTFASLLYTASVFMYLPIVIYIPALAFSQATDTSIHLITPIICAVCVFYTTVGGLKAVVWTDALQFFVMIGSIVAVFCLGVSSAGGATNIWKTNVEHQRIAIDFSLYVTKRDTFWSSGVAFAVNWFSYVAINQGIVQKCISLPNYKAVRSALSIFAVGTFLVMSMCAFTGLIMFTKYFGCDPLLSGKIKKPDQLLTYYVMDIAREIPGLPGLFTAGIFSAALSTLSAVINCLSATIYKDFLSNYVKKDTSEKTISNYLKILAVTIGIINTSLVYAIPYLESLVPLTMSLSGIADGATLGIFTGAFLLPWMNATGALYGGIASLIFMSWTVLGSQYYKSIKVITYPPLPVSIEKCQDSMVFNATSLASQITNSAITETTPLILYRISFYYYVTMGALIVIIVGLIISKLKPQDKPLKKKYFSPLIRKFIKDTSEDANYYCLRQTDEVEEFRGKL